MTAQRRPPQLRSQKSISVAHDGSVFVAEINSVEVFRDNQKVFELKSSYAPSAVGASSSVIAVGEVSPAHSMYSIS